MGVFTAAPARLLHLQAGWQRDNFFFFFAAAAAGPLSRFPGTLFLQTHSSRHEGTHHAISDLWSLGARMAPRPSPRRPEGGTAGPAWASGTRLAPCGGERARPRRRQFPPRPRSPARRTSRPPGGGGSPSRAPFRTSLSITAAHQSGRSGRGGLWLEGPHRRPRPPQPPGPPLRPTAPVIDRRAGRKLRRLRTGGAALPSGRAGRSQQTPRRACAVRGRLLIPLWRGRRYFY